MTLVTNSIIYYNVNTLCKTENVELLLLLLKYQCIEKYETSDNK